MICNKTVLRMMGNFLSWCLLYCKISASCLSLLIFIQTSLSPSRQESSDPKKLITRCADAFSTIYHALTISFVYSKKLFTTLSFDDFRASSAHLRTVPTMTQHQNRPKKRRNENNCRNYHNEIIFFNNFIVEGKKRQQQEREKKLKFSGPLTHIVPFFVS